MISFIEVEFDVTGSTDGTSGELAITILFAEDSDIDVVHL